MRFARALGISPGSYYLRLRLQTAQRLVSDTQLSIRGVALRCGFDSLSSFSRAFKRQYGGEPHGNCARAANDGIWACIRHHHPA